jgi:DNA-binding protein HU-beta
MNIADLAEKLATDHDLPKNKAKQLLEATFAAVGDAIARGEEVSIQGFGKFKVSDRPAREGRNPATGETIQIAASSPPCCTG